MRKYLYSFSIENTQYDGLTLNETIEIINQYISDNNFKIVFNYDKIYNLIKREKKCFTHSLLIKNMSRKQINAKGEIVN